MCGPESGSGLSPESDPGSGPKMMVASMSSFDGEIGGASWDVEAAAPALESLRRLFATIVAQVGRRTSE